MAILVERITIRVDRLRMAYPAFPHAPLREGSDCKNGSRRVADGSKNVILGGVA